MPCDRLQVGDWVCLPFNIACGFCGNCDARPDRLLPDRASAGMAGAAYGFAGMGPYQGGQAEYLRVPFGDFNACGCPTTPRRSRTTT